MPAQFFWHSPCRAVDSTANGRAPMAKKSMAEKRPKKWSVQCTSENAARFARAGPERK